ncbi:hypothetical protein SCWH03_49440 [Streptomyces pacificus]|uniref:Uncharacterized protein n=1 Tax=Streptomyces pacificus TaxID=2705029 RepID=A0A6A0B0Q0_9ACTN|nr:hypothetical protein SCWH03_49440 [Streptomyces pacificus]
MVWQGQDGRHRAYPFGILARQAGRVGQRRWPPTLPGFGAQALTGPAGDALQQTLARWGASAVRGHDAIAPPATCPGGARGPGRPRGPARSARCAVEQ